MKATPFNQKTISDFHAKRGLGVGIWGDHVLLLTAQGQKSGDAITTPLVYGREGDGYAVVASKGGSPTHPTWFANIRADPKVEVQVANGGRIQKFKARARVIEARAEHDRLYQEMSKVWPSFVDYQKRTERLIPVVFLEPERYPSVEPQRPFTRRFKPRNAARIAEGTTPVRSPDSCSSAVRSRRA